jgi:hypothetical protein
MPTEPWDEHWITGWEHMLRGKAYARSGDMSRASADMREGLAILEHAVGRENRLFLAAQLAYSQVLDCSGLYAEAAQLRSAAEQGLKEFAGIQGVRCTISVAGFRP